MTVETDPLANIDPDETVTCPSLSPPGPHLMEDALRKVLQLSPVEQSYVMIFREPGTAPPILGIDEAKELANRWGLLSE